MSPHGANYHARADFLEMTFFGSLVHFGERMNVLYLTGAVVMIAAQAIVKKAYNIKLKNKGAFMFSAVSVLAAAL